MSKKRKTLKVTVLGDNINNIYYLKFSKEHYELNFGNNLISPKATINRILSKKHLHKPVHIELLYPRGKKYVLFGKIENITKDYFEIIGTKQN